MSKRAFHFRGLSVLVPAGIVPVEFSIPGDIQGIANDFTVIRYIANIALFSEAELKVVLSNKAPLPEPLMNFQEQPIEFRLSYKKSDVDLVNGDFRSLKLAYWNTHKWVIISDDVHEYQILPPSTARVAEAKIGSWEGDPTLAWGR